MTEENTRVDEDQAAAQAVGTASVESVSAEKRDADAGGPETAVFDALGEVEENDESEIAADYLEELLDIADLDGDIDIEVRQNRTYLSVVTDGEHHEDLDVLVGRRGEVLDALQELVRLSVLAATGNRSRLILDIDGHRVRREDELKKIAEDAVEKARREGKSVHLKPLTPYERKIVHDIVAAHGLLSESEGEGSSRHVVVSADEAGVEAS